MSTPSTPSARNEVRQTIPRRWPSPMSAAKIAKQVIEEKTA